MKLVERCRLWHRAYRYALRTEKYEVALMRSLVRRGDFVIDIGAHKAAFAWWLARSVGPRGCVLAFEPMPKLAAYMRQVAACFPPGQLRLVEAALSNRRGRTQLFFPGDHLGAASIEIRETRMLPPVEVATETLDGYLAENHPAAQVAFIKCDVENHELAVFRGAQRLLASSKPTLLFESTNLADGRDKCGPVFDFLASLGYVGYFFVANALVPIADYDPARHSVPDLNQNFAFAHPEGRDWRKFGASRLVRSAA